MPMPMPAPSPSEEEEFVCTKKKPTFSTQRTLKKRPLPVPSGRHIPRVNVRREHWPEEQPKSNDGQLSWNTSEPGCRQL